MVALFVVLTIAVFVLLDILVIQKAEMRMEERRAESARKNVLLVSEVGMTMADGGEELKKKEEEGKKEEEEK